MRRHAPPLQAEPLDGPAAPAVVERFLDEPVSSELEGQLRRAAALPGMRRIAAMPDLHLGSGIPVGAAFLADRVYPHLVGSDIGCGMFLARVPTPPRRFSLDKAAERRLDALDRPHDGNLGALASLVDGAPRAFDNSLGTIGGGNHFAELLMRHDLGSEQDEASHAADVCYILVHSGSRAFGHSVSTGTPAYGRQEGLEAGTEPAVEYLSRHDAAALWARANRRLIAERFAEALRLPALEPVLDISHNRVAPLEQDGTTRYLHRKGAAPADEGHVVIPGSRGTYSYIVEPVAPDAQTRNLFSLAHGAGRRMSRSDTERLKRRFKKEDLLSIRDAKRDIRSRVICGDGNLVWEEAPQAYKDIEKVIAALTSRGLIRVSAVLKPLLTFKTGGKSDDD